MRFYRRLAPFKAISFDLDDTLYDNYPVIVNAEKQLQSHLAEIAPECSALGRSFWQRHRQACLTNQPELCHDVTALRLACLESGLLNLGYNKPQAKQKADTAFQYFLSHRNQLTVSPTVKTLLSNLTEKFPLIAISNGNVDIEQIGIAQYFTKTYFAGAGNRQKPESHMFDQCCDALSILPKQLLHIGDCTHADIYGALKAGCQTIWINNDDFAVKNKPLKVLPNAEFDQVEQLSMFL